MLLARAPLLIPAPHACFALKVRANVLCTQSESKTSKGILSFAARIAGEVTQARGWQLHTTLSHPLRPQPRQRILTMPPASSRLSRYTLRGTSSIHKALLYALATPGSRRREAALMWALGAPACGPAASAASVPNRDMISVGIIERLFIPIPHAGITVEVGAQLRRS